MIVMRHGITVLRRLVTWRDQPMPLLDHMEDLRRRILFALAGLFVTFSVGLAEQDRLLHWLLQPAGVRQLVALTVLEPLLVKFKLAMVFALVAGFPWLLLQGLLFVGPAMSERESRYIMPITGASLVLAVLGVLFGYYLIMPISTRWLIDQAGTVMTLQITALSYVSYALWFLAAAAITFQTPLVVLALVGMGVISSARLRQEWRYVYAAITILAAVITPDWSPVSMLLVAAAMVALYELSLLLARALMPGR
jgi:sec-independent protein translocase protein TatC